MNPQLSVPLWTIRPYYPGDERDLVVLFQRVFGRSLTETHWRWKLKQLPSPVENVWLAVGEDGKPVFQYAGIPVRYHLPIGERTVMIGVDTMANPECRRQGILTAIARFAYDTWRKAGIPFVLGLPNEQWGSRTDVLGWKTLFSLQWLVRPLQPAALLARRLGISTLSQLPFLDAGWNLWWDRNIQSDETVHTRQVDRAGSEFDVLWQTCRADRQISAIRDSAWVNWRYVTAPAFAYRVLLAERSGQPVGYSVYRLQETAGRKLGFIAELLTPQSDIPARSTLIARTLQQLQAEGAEAAITLAIPNTTIFRAFRRAGFIFSRGSFRVHVAPLDPTLPMGTVRDPQNWCMTGGDFDVI